jgi:hypothetical protein
MKESLDLEKFNFEDYVTLVESFSHVKFFEREHYYEINGERCPLSVSKLISKYEKPFNSEQLAKKVAQRDGFLVEDVLNKWENLKNYSCHKGSEFHLFVENYLERRQIPLNRGAFINFISNEKNQYDEKDVEKYYTEMAHLINNFKSFYEWWKQDHVLIKSEFVVGDKETKLCGTIDNLSYNKKTKQFVLFDYKTNKEIKRKNKYGEYMLEPFKHIPKCEYSKYSLQLWLYQLIIERNTPFKVSDAYIVWIGDSDYELINYKNYKSEALMMLESL